jgi:hypothetical protein
VYLSECSDKGFINFSYGRAYISQSELLGGEVARPTGDDEVDGEVLIHSCNLGVSGAAVDPGCVTVRLMSCLVRGSTFSASYQNSLAKMRSRVGDAIKEKKQLFDRLQQLAEREKDKGSLEDDDSLFVLDPSLLTVQDLKVNVAFPSLKVTVESLCVLPMAIREKAGGSSKVKSFPLIAVELKGIECSATAKNNPWDAQASASFQSLKVLDLAAMRQLKRIREGVSPLVLPKIQLDPLVSLPSAKANFTITQISSIGRNIDGLLNLSCFEWTGELSFLSFKFIVSPRSFHSLSSQGLTPLWKAYRVLQHLWIPRFPFGLGSSFMSLGSESSVRSIADSFESSFRLGGMYEEFPLHVNHCKEIWAGLRHVTNVDGAAPLQSTVCAFLTEKRTCDVELTVQLDDDIMDGDNEEDDDDWGDAFEDTDDVADDAAASASAAATSASGNTLMDWMGFGSIATNKTESAVASPATVSIEASGLSEKSLVAEDSVSNSKTLSNPGSSLWSHERSAMQKRIAELEAKTKDLESKLSDERQLSSKLLTRIDISRRTGSGNNTPTNLIGAGGSSENLK